MRALALALVVLGLCSACGSSAAQPARRFVVVTPLGGMSGLSRVESVDARGRVVRTIARRAFDASVSPDGRLVALDESNGLYVERISSSRPRLLVRSIPDIWGPASVWSPDSNQLLVAVSGGSRLAVVTVATGAERLLPLPEKPSVTYTPVGWSGAAHEILFEAGSGCCLKRLLVARPTGASPQEIYAVDAGENDSPYASWSPDGKWVAYTAEFDDPDWGMGVIDVASGRTTALDNRNQFLQAPVWAPDSSRFAVGLSVFSNRGVRLYSTGMPSATPVAWTGAGLYLTAESAGSAKLIFAPTGQNSAETVFSLPHGQAFTSVQPLG